MFFISTKSLGGICGTVVVVVVVCVHARTPVCAHLQLTVGDDLRMMHEQTRIARDRREGGRGFGCGGHRIRM